MNKYSAINGCPKCGTLVTFDRYFEDHKQIRRKCTRCDFLWWEEPLDSIVEKKVKMDHVSTEYVRIFPEYTSASNDDKLLCLQNIQSWIDIEREILKEKIENE